MSAIVIETPRLFLRTWHDGDDDLHKLHTGTPAFKRWLEDADMAPRRPGSTTARQQRMNAELGFCFWVVERRSDGEFLGYCGLKRVDAQGTDLVGEHEIGWGLREEAWGKRAMRGKPRRPLWTAPLPSTGPTAFMPSP